MFKLLRKWTDDNGRLNVEYEARFLENCKYVVKRCTDVWFPERKSISGGTVKARFLNTASNVSYYDKLIKAAGV